MTKQITQTTPELITRIGENVYYNGCKFKVVSFAGKKVTIKITSVEGTLMSADEYIYVNEPLCYFTNLEDYILNNY